MVVCDQSVSKAQYRKQQEEEEKAKKSDDDDDDNAMEEEEKEETPKEEKPPKPAVNLNDAEEGRTLFIRPFHPLYPA